MEILIAIGIIILFVWIFSSNSSKKSPPNKPTSTSSSLEVERQVQARRREEQLRVQAEQLAQDQKRQFELEKQRVRAQNEQLEQDLRQKSEQENQRLRIQKEQLAQEKRRKAEQESQRQRVLEEQMAQARRLASEREAQQVAERILKANPNARLRSPPAHSYKNDWTSYQTILQQNNIQRLYHFTDRANLPSIRECGGLLSWDYCKQNNIAIPKPGGSPTSWILDERKGLQNFVRVSFIKDHPMMFVAQNDGRIISPVVLEISPEVIYFKSTRYASQNAAKNGVTAEATLEKFNEIKYPLLRKRYFDLSVEDKPFYQAEVLILEKIPLNFIVNINYV